MPNSFIFVQPASPNEKPDAATSLGSSVALTPSGSTSPSSFPSMRSRRIKLFGFTPTDQNDDGPSSQDESGVIPLNEPMTNVKLVASSSKLASRRPGAFKSNTDMPASSAMSGRTSSADDAYQPPSKTPMLRKKSGELVRPSLKQGDQSRSTSAVRARSAPATPISPKYVHFDTQLEHVKHFLAQQRPAAVSRNGSPTETETEDEPDAYPFPAMSATDANNLVLRLPNFPSTLDSSRDVLLEKLELSTDGKSLVGVVRVHNLSFEKWVAVRFTLDNWQTVSEVSAVHKESLGAQSDRFGFTIKLHDLLSRITERKMHLAIRYTVAGREIWDNNDGQNYRIEFAKRPLAMTVPASSAAPSFDASSTTKRQTWSVTNPRQADDRMADLRKGLDRLLAEDLDPESALAPKLKSTNDTSFSNRYTFGNSFKMYGGRPAFEEANTRNKAASPSYMSTLVNGMPTTVYSAASSTPTPTPTAASNEPTRTASPIQTRKQDMLPDFGTYRPRATPDDSTPTEPSSSSSAPWLKLNDFPRSALHERYHTHPVSSPSNGSTMHVLSPIPLGRFMNHRPTLHSPAHSPVDSPRNGSPVAGSPAMSPAASPAVSPGRSRSPELFSAPASIDDHPWSPASSVDTIMTASYSPESETTPSSSDTSVPDSPINEASYRPKDARDFSTFLDRVRGLVSLLSSRC